MSKHKKYNSHEQENIILHPQWQPALPEHLSTVPFVPALAPVPGDSIACPTHQAKTKKKI
ncbi:hypothetical protein ACTQ43_07395 [Segatella copri]|uniref:hypothetical protein n=1 Tax=Segatella copri TaxID=165179 RepID=UPI003F976014